MAAAILSFISSAIRLSSVIVVPRYLKGQLYLYYYTVKYPLGLSVLRNKMVGGKGRKWWGKEEGKKHAVER